MKAPMECLLAANWSKPYLKGSRYFDFKAIQSKCGLDAEKGSECFGELSMNGKPNDILEHVASQLFEDVMRFDSVWSAVSRSTTES